MARSLRQRSIRHCGNVWPSVRGEAERKAAAAFPDVRDVKLVAILRRSAALDATVVGLADALPGPTRDLDVIYLPGLDIAQHALLSGDAAGASLPSAMDARVAALHAYLAFLHDLLGPWLRPSAGEFVMLITQPGRVTIPAAGTFTAFGLVPTPDHAEQPTINAEGAASVEDVAPTILNALGVPLSRELAGHPLGRFARGSPICRDIWAAVQGCVGARRQAARSGDDRTVAEPGICAVTAAQDVGAAAIEETATRRAAQRLRRRPSGRRQAGTDTGRSRARPTDRRAARPTPARRRQTRTRPRDPRPSREPT